MALLVPGCSGSRLHQRGERRPDGGGSSRSPAAALLITGMTFEGFSLFRE